MLYKKLALCIFSSIGLMSTVVHASPADSPTGYALPAPEYSVSENGDYDFSNNLPIYGGVDVGFSYIDYGDLDINIGLNANDLLEDKNTHGSIYLGYQVTPVFAVELSYFSTLKENKKNRVADTNNDQRIDGVSLDVVANHPLNNKLSLIGAIGMGYYTQHITTDDIPVVLPDEAPSSFTDSSTAYRLGGGVEYALSERWGSRIMARYSNLDFNDTHRDALWQISAGLKYSF